MVCTDFNAICAVAAAQRENSKEKKEMMIPGRVRKGRTLSSSSQLPLVAAQISMLNETFFSMALRVVAAGQGSRLRSERCQHHEVTEREKEKK